MGDTLLASLYWSVTLQPVTQRSKNSVLKKDRDHAEVWLLFSKSVFEKEKTVSFYNPMELHNPG